MTVCVLYDRPLDVAIGPIMYCGTPDDDVFHNCHEPSYHYDLDWRNHLKKDLLLN